MNKKFKSLILLISLNSYGEDKIYLNLPNVSDENAQQIIKKTKLQKYSFDERIKVYGKRPPEKKKASKLEVNNFFKSAKVNVMNLDQLDRDLLYMAVRDWTSQKVISKFEKSLPVSEIKKALEYVGK